MLACVVDMVNLTVSIPEKLKEEMDKFSNVNWSELTRKAIQSYLKNRTASYPPIDFTIDGMSITYDDIINQPKIFFRLKTINKLDSQLIIDRILFTVEFDKEFGRNKRQGAFNDQSLEYQKILSAENNTTIYLSSFPNAELLRKLSKILQSTFWIYVTLHVYVKGFDNPQIKVPYIKVAIDEWKNQITYVLNKFDSYWNKE